MENYFVPAWPQEAQLFHYHHPHQGLNRGSFIPSWPPHHGSSSSSFHVHGFPSSSTSVEGVAEDRATAASKSHSEAEKRRRERINSHLSTLRQLIPESDKMDKAALLGCVVDHVKELKRKAVEIGKIFTIPTEVDQVTVDCHEGSVDPTTTTTTTTTNNNKDRIFLKVSVCCDDRPELFTDIIRALKGLKLRTVRAEMATMGGRVTSVMILCTKDKEESVCLSSLKQSLKVVLSRVASSSTTSMCGLSSKRQRMLLPSHYSHLSV